MRSTEVTDWHRFTTNSKKVFSAPKLTGEQISKIFRTWQKRRRARWNVTFGRIFIFYFYFLSSVSWIFKKNCVLCREHLLTYFVRGSITALLTSCLTKPLNISWIQTSQIGGQHNSNTSPYEVSYCCIVLCFSSFHFLFFSLLFEVHLNCFKNNKSKIAFLRSKTKEQFFKTLLHALA